MPGYDRNSMKNIQMRLDVLFKTTIKDNVINLFYPPTTATLIYTFGLLEPEKTKLPLHQHLMKMLKSEFKKAFDKNQVIALDMLPTDTHYDKNNNKLIRIITYGKGRSRTEQLLLN